MNVDRIERALREGPPDEPIYVPGAFRRTERTGWTLALAAASLGLALAVGVVIGSGLGILRGDPMDRTGGPVTTPQPLSAADLEGTWTSGVLDRDAWAEALLDRGIAQADIDAFLLHDPFESTARYYMVFRGAGLTIGAFYDDTPPQVLTEARFQILADGRLRVTERVDGVAPEDECVVTLVPNLREDNLSFDFLGVPCDADAEIANISFFELVTYTRTEP